MRIFSIILLCCLLASAYSKRKRPDAAKPAEETTMLAVIPAANSLKAIKPVVKKPVIKASKEVEAMLKEIIDVRMMDAEEGRLIASKGTTSQIKNYGQMMIKDQSILEKKIRMLAKQKGVELPSTISNEKQDGLKSLKEKNGKDLDRKFIRMIRKDHKKDLRLFRKASKSDDQQLKSFANEYYPLIESHLKKINEIDKEFY